MRAALDADSRIQTKADIELIRPDQIAQAYDCVVKKDMH